MASLDPFSTTDPEEVEFTRIDPFALTTLADPVVDSTFVPEFKSSRTPGLVGGVGMVVVVTGMVVVVTGTVVVVTGMVVVVVDVVVVVGLPPGD